MGDYLDLNGKNALGTELRNACGLGGQFLDSPPHCLLKSPV